MESFPARQVSQVTRHELVLQGHEREEKQTIFCINYHNNYNTFNTVCLLLSVQHLVHDVALHLHQEEEDLGLGDF